MRTYAPCGQTPVLQQDCKYTHLSAIAAISPQGEMISHIQENSFDGTAIVIFLQCLLATFKKDIHLIWDGAKIHCGDAVKNFLATDIQAKRLHLYRIPPYSPELNPTEQLWNHAKNVQLKNLFSKNISQLKQNVQKALANIQLKKHTIQAFFNHPKVTF